MRYIKLPVILIPVILRPWLLTARRMIISSLKSSTETPLMIIKLVAIVGFFWIMAASGQAMGRSLLIERGLSHIQEISLLVNMWVFLGVALYAFALPLSLNELFLNPDIDLISASPYPRLRKLVGILIGMGLKILPISLIILVPTFALANQLIPLSTVEIILIGLTAIYVPCSLAILSSIILMSLVPSRQVIKMCLPVVLILVLIAPIGMPHIFSFSGLTSTLRDLCFNPLTENNLNNSLTTGLAKDLQQLEGILATGGGFRGEEILHSRTAFLVSVLLSAVIPAALCLLLSYPLYGVALSGSKRFRSINLSSIRVRTRPLEAKGVFITAIAAKCVRLLVLFFSSTTDRASREAALHEKFIKAFLRQELLTIIRDPLRLLHLALLVVLSLLYLGAMPSILYSSRFLVEFSSVINFILVSFLVASFANRFVITSFSHEGEASWIVYSSPLTSSQVMLSKFLAWCILLIPSGIILGAAGCMLMEVSLTNTVLLAFVIAASVPSIVSSALTTGLKLRPKSGYPSASTEMAGYPFGIIPLFAMVIAATVIAFNALLLLMTQLAPNQAISFLWISTFSLLNFVFTKARLTIGVGRFNE